MLPVSNFQLTCSLFLMNTKSYLKFRTIRGTPQKWVGFGKPVLCPSISRPFSNQFVINNATISAALVGHGL